MERLTLFHQDVPITYHPLIKDRFSIGASPDNDLVLAGDRVADHHMVVFRTAEGSWRAGPSEGACEVDAVGEVLGPDSRIPVDSFSLGFECIEDPAPDGWPPDDSLGLVGSSSEMRTLRRKIQSVAPLRAPVLVTGETGTGKELVSRGLHLASCRSAGPLVVVNCGGLTDSLMEDTFFGHKRGAFTGATEGRKGVFEQAGGGTLFLDEVGELAPSQQAALLRVLDDNTVRRIGDERQRTIDFRLVTATNRDLRRQVETGAFRVDLYHRISAVTIATSPLRDRPEDIGELAAHFLHEMAAELGKRSLCAEAIEKLLTHHWPGNARELRNVVYRAAAFSDSDEVTETEIQLEIENVSINRKMCRTDTLPPHQIEQALRHNEGNVSAAAKDLGVPRSSLRDRINRLCKDPRFAQFQNPSGVDSLR